MADNTYDAMVIRSGISGLILFTCIAFFLSCSTPADKTPSADAPKPADSTASMDKTIPVNKTSDENLSLINKWAKAIEDHDTAAMASLTGDNFKAYGPSIGDSAGKSEYLSNWKYNFDRYYSTIKYDRVQTFATTVGGNEPDPGDWVSNWSYISIGYKDGKGPVHLWVNAVFKIENAKIAKVRVFYNEADWLRQLGYKLVKPVKKNQGQSL